MFKLLAGVVTLASAVTANMSCLQEKCDPDLMYCGKGQGGCFETLTAAIESEVPPTSEELMTWSAETTRAFQCYKDLCQETDGWLVAGTEPVDDKVCCMQVTANCIACTRGFESAEAFCLAENPLLAIQIPGCEDFIVRDTDGDGNMDSEDESLEEAKDTDGDGDVDEKDEELSSEVKNSQVVQDVQTTISCEFLNTRRCKLGKVAFCAFDYEAEECFVNCTALTRYKCLKQNPIGCHWQPNTATCDFDEDSDTHSGFINGGFVKPATSWYEAAASNVDDSLTGLCNINDDCCNPAAKCITASGKKADNLVDEWESGSEQNGTKMGGKNADVTLGTCVIDTGAITPGLGAWPCGAPADLSKENEQRRIYYDEAKELLAEKYPDGWAAANKKEHDEAQADDDEYGSGDDSWDANHSDHSMDETTSTLVTIIIIGGIVMAAGILAFGMCKRGQYDPTHNLLPMSDLDSGSDVSTPMLEKYG